MKRNTAWDMTQNVNEEIAITLHDTRIRITQEGYYTEKNHIVITSLSELNTLIAVLNAAKNEYSEE